ncbi:MAG: hypothetical protein K940chlam3_01027 [Chlamydiae bacterium]|nr:hypothetical protein [Chlamydiota bacterium]
MDGICGNLFGDYHVPPEIFLHVVQNVDSFTIFKSLSVCKAWNANLDNDTQWRWQVNQLGVDSKKENETWKECFIKIQCQLRLISLGSQKHKKLIEIQAKIDKLKWFDRLLEFPLLKLVLKEHFQKAHVLELGDKFGENKHSIQITHEMMGEHSVARGVDRWGREFFSVKLRIKNVHDYMVIGEEIEEVITIYVKFAKSEYVYVNAKHLSFFPSRGGVRIISDSGYWIMFLKNLLDQGTMTVPPYRHFFQGTNLVIVSIYRSQRS